MKLNKSIAFASLITVTLSAQARVNQQDLDALELELRILNGNTALILFDTIGTVHRSIAWLEDDINDRLDKHGRKLKRENRRHRRTNRRIDQLDLSINGLTIQQDKDRQMTEAGIAASIASGHAIRPDDGMRWSIGHYGNEAAFSLGGRRDEFTFSITVDTSNNVGAGFGFNF